MNEEKQTGLLPEYSVPNIEISEIRSEDENILTLRIGDMNIFLEQIEKLKKVGKIEFVRNQRGKDSNKRSLTIRIMNLDKSKVKIL